MSRQHQSAAGGARGGAPRDACEAHGTVACAACHGRGHQEWGVLSDECLAILDKARTPMRFQPGDALFRQGQPCLGVYCLDAGDVAIRKHDARGRSAIVRLVHAGQSLGYRTFFAGGTYAATAEALTDCHACFVPAPVVRQLLEREPALGTRFLERAAEELRAAEEERLKAVMLTIPARLAHFLLALRDRFGWVGEDGELVLELPLSRQEMAALVGARRESVARAIADLERAEVAHFSGRTVRIPDLDALLDAADEDGAE